MIMPKKKYIVALSFQERENLERLTTTGKSPAYKLNHARILLKADIDQEGGGWRDQDISDALDISVSTIERVRQRFVEQSLAAAIARQPPIRTKPRLLDGEQEAYLVALACGEAPAGQGRWTVRLLADRLVELGYVESISHETVRQVLKKTNSSPGCKNAG
jgi:transposase